MSNAHLVLQLLMITVILMAYFYTRLSRNPGHALRNARMVTIACSVLTLPTIFMPWVMVLQLLVLWATYFGVSRYHAMQPAYAPPKPSQPASAPVIITFSGDAPPPVGSMPPRPTYQPLHHPARQPSADITSVQTSKRLTPADAPPPSQARSPRFVGSTILTTAQEHRKYLFAAFKHAQQYVIIESGWASSAVIDETFIEAAKNAMRREVTLYFVYGYQSRDQTNKPPEQIDADQRLTELATWATQHAPGHLHIRNTANHSKTLICDDQYATTGSWNWLSNRNGRNKETTQVNRHPNDIRKLTEQAMRAFWS